MDNNDRQAIEGLFGRLGHAAQAQPQRDADAEALIAELIARNPGSAYYLAQTVIMQGQALDLAQEQIEQLQRRPEPSAGGLFGRMFGSGQPQSRAMPQRHPQPAQQGSGPWSGGRPGGGGFMAGAAQTAMGVAGGVLLGNAIGGMFAGPAEAGQPEEPMMEDEGTDDFE